MRDNEMIFFWNKIEIDWQTSHCEPNSNVEMKVGENWKIHDSLTWSVFKLVI